MKPSLTLLILTMTFSSFLFSESNAYNPKHTHNKVEGSSGMSREDKIKQILNHDNHAWLVIKHTKKKNSGWRKRRLKIEPKNPNQLGDDIVISFVRRNGYPASNVNQFGLPIKQSKFTKIPGGMKVVYYYKLSNKDDCKHEMTLYISNPSEKNDNKAFFYDIQHHDSNSNCHGTQASIRLLQHKDNGGSGRN